MRDNEWLESKLEWLIRRYFRDLEISNQLIIKFGRKAKRRLGSIKKISRSKGIISFHRNIFDEPSIITITGYFKDPRIPEYVVMSTIAHELAHYAHGFSSPLAQKFQHPHRGGIVHKELQSRGLCEMEKRAEKWLRKEWASFINF